MLDEAWRAEKVHLRPLAEDRGSARAGEVEGVANITFSFPQCSLSTIGQREPSQCPYRSDLHSNPFLEESLAGALKTEKEETSPAMKQPKEEESGCDSAHTSVVARSQKLYNELRQLTSPPQIDHSYFSMAEDYFIMRQDYEYRLHTPRRTSKDSFIASFEPILQRSFKSVSKRIDRLRALTNVQRQVFFFFLKKFSGVAVSRKAIFASRGDMLHIKPLAGGKIGADERSFLREIEGKLRTAGVPMQEHVMEWLLQGEQAGAAGWELRASPRTEAAPSPQSSCSVSPEKGEEHRPYLQGPGDATASFMERVEALDSMIAFVCATFKEDVKDLLPALNAHHRAQHTLASPRPATPNLRT